MPLLVVLDARQPALMLARRALCSGLHVRPNAFGNALGESLARSAQPDPQYTLNTNGVKLGEGGGRVKLGTGDDGASIPTWNADKEAVLQRALNSTDPVISETDTDAQILSKQLKQHGYDGEVTPVGWKEFKNGLGAIWNDVKSGYDKVEHRVLYGTPPAWEVAQDERYEAARQRFNQAAELRSNGVLLTATECVPLDPYGTGNNPGSIGATPHPRDGSFDDRLTRSTMDAAGLEFGGLAFKAALAPVSGLASKAYWGVRSDAALARYELGQEFRLGLQTDLALPTTAVQVGTVTDDMSAGFRPAPRSGLEFELDIRSHTDSLRTVDLATKQRFGPNGEIVSRPYDTSFIKTTFNEETGGLYIDKMAAQPGHHIGREMISNVIESIGPQNIRFVEAEFADTNLAVFRSSLSAKMTPLEAAQSTPLGKALSDLGYGNRLVTVEDGYPRPQVRYEIGSRK